jgi:hypothetical protein
MTELLEKVMGKHVLEMCVLLDKTFPELSEEMEIIKKGINATITRGVVMGWVFGFISGLLIVIGVILFTA